MANITMNSEKNLNYYLDLEHEIFNDFCWLLTLSYMMSLFFYQPIDDHLTLLKGLS
ncbi:hypothetical protein FIV04_26455 (plasmid) [Vibrio sp. THAF190c]|nr:hypothetical protein FIV04_26455 [Vibrio sp. THAF190c]